MHKEIPLEGVPSIAKLNRYESNVVKVLNFSKTAMGLAVSMPTVFNQCAAIHEL